MLIRRRRTGQFVLLMGLALSLTAGLATASRAIEVEAVSERIDAGSQHNCAVMDGGDVRCWGLNEAGQLGYGNSGQPGQARIGDNEHPVSAGVVDLGGDSAWKVTAGDYHSCVILLSDFAVACWGNNGSGILGTGGFDPNNPLIGDDETPGSDRVDLGANRSARQIAAGGSHTCVVTDREKVMCWGDAGLGALGYGDEEDIGDDEQPAAAGLVDLGAGRTVRDIAAGAAHTCAVMDNGDVFCWGDNDAGALGYPDLADGEVGDDETPASVGRVDLGGKKAVSVAAGENFTCVVLDTRQVRCWGDGAAGRLGSGSTSDIGDDEDPDSANAGHVPLGGVDVLQVVAGDDHACARLAGGDVRCWGEGGDGRLGLGATTDLGDDEDPDTQPVVDLAGEQIVAVTAGQFHTCAVNDDGRVRCWGQGDVGAVGKANGAELGDDEAPGSVSPISLGALVTTSLVIPSPTPNPPPPF